MAIGGDVHLGFDRLAGDWFVLIETRDQLAGVRAERLRRFLGINFVWVRDRAGLCRWLRLVDALSDRSVGDCSLGDRSVDDWRDDGRIDRSGLVRRNDADSLGLGLARLDAPVCDACRDHADAE